MSRNLVAESTGKKFEFTKENLKKAEAIVAKYPKGQQRSAMLPLLDLAQRQNGNWVSMEVMQYLATLLLVPYIKVYEVATFYTMFNLQPIGKYHVQVCRTTPCWLRGSDNLTNLCKKKLGVGLHETTRDGKFTLTEVECLGACVNAPMVQINDDYYEDLSPELLEDVLDDLAAGKKPNVGSQTGRTCSAPLGELTSLAQFANQNNAATKPAVKAVPKKAPTVAKKKTGKK